MPGLLAVRTVTVTVAFACLAFHAHAHKPVAIDGGATSITNAHEVADPAVSLVGYHQASPNAPELWFTFDADPNTTLTLQLGVPKIDRYAGIRPAMALVGPDLPVADLPFDLPDGYGAVVFRTEGQQPELFYEEFTGTSSWRFEPVHAEVSVQGRYYLVGFVPSGENAKFWMALGETESFGLADLISLPGTLVAVRTFHEVFPFGGLLGWALLLLLVASAGILGLLFS